MVLGRFGSQQEPGRHAGAGGGRQALALQNQLNFSRDMEREADRVGYG
jgi:predicted Zn-dependent protease